MVCKVQGVGSVASVIPLCLTGGAFAVYLQLAEVDRKLTKKVKEAFLVPFAVDPYVACEWFMSRKLHSGEPPDVYLAELQHFVSLLGKVSNRALACAIVAGLQKGARQLLRGG